MKPSRKFSKPQEKLLTPNLPEKELLKFKKIINKALRNNIKNLTNNTETIASNLRDIVKSESKRSSNELLACLLVYADLFEQGWALNNKSKLSLNAPGLTVNQGENFMDVKKRLRTYMQSGQKRQLKEPSVQEFLRQMTINKKKPQGVHSIASVIDDGKELACILRNGQRLNNEDKDDYLNKYFRPEIEICEEGLCCSDTGIKLNEIWRFFRHTWASVYRPIPGRQMSILIRNAARMNRPIMGIAMLSSPVMKLNPRDNWVGWTFKETLDKLYTGGLDHKIFIQSMNDRVDESISEIRWDDIATQELINSPSLSGIDKLQRISTKAGYQREDELIEIYEQTLGKVSSTKDPNILNMSETDWIAASEDNLFVSKRAYTLAKLLHAKLELKKHQLEQNPGNLRYLMTSKSGRNAVEIILGEFRKAGLASQIMDLSICGAVPPYGGLLAGKLVALSMASNEINEALQKRYGSRVSIIASQMAGQAIIRDTTLKAITTTSLYGIGTSQYNRLKLKASDYHGISNDINWEKLGGHTSGYGQMHLSSETLEVLKKIGWDKKGYANRTNRFGEGTSTRMHQASLGLNAIGFDSNLVLKHETPRIVLGCDIFSNARDNLLGRVKMKNERKSSINAISRAWRNRWLRNRINNPDVINRLETETVQSVFESLKIIDNKDSNNKQTNLI